MSVLRRHSTEEQTRGRAPYGAAITPRPSLSVAAGTGLAAASATLAGLALRVGLLTVPGLGGGLIGVGDNGDAYRLFCTAGLAPDTPDGRSLWRGVVVTAFTTGSPPCTAAPSSAATLLGLVVPSTPGPWSLTSSAWLLVSLVALGVGIGAAALATVRPARALLVVLPLAGLLVVPWWSRFLVSLYADATALVATVWVLLGLLVIAGVPPQRRARAAAPALLFAGGLLGATAKPGFVVVGLVAAGALALTAVGSRPVLRRLAGPVTALALVVAVTVPLLQAVQGQARSYGAVNAHNVVFTALLPHLGPDRVLPAVGLPPGAAAHSGEGFYWAGGVGIPGWGAAIGDRPAEATAAARALLLEHPGTAATMIADGLTATMRPQLGYLPSAPRGTAPERFEGRTVYPEAGPQTALLRDWLDGITAGWLPLAVVLAALVAAVATLLPRARRADSLTVGLVRTAGAAALLALGVVALAVAGDGYYELSKHVWLASYLILTAGLTGMTALLAGAARSVTFRVRSRSWTRGNRTFVARS